MRLPQKVLKSTLLISSALGLISCSVSPKLITQQERDKRIKADWHAIFKDQEGVKGSVDLYQAMARAVKYNLDIRTKYMEQAYAQADTKYAYANLMPSLVTDAGYTVRNNPYSVRSPNNPTTLTSTEDRDQNDAALQFSWNALDFGISYIEAKQKSDLFLISQERKRKIIQQIIRDTRYAYWQAWAAQSLLPKVKPFIHEINDAITQSRRAEQEKLLPPAKAAYFRAELWQTYEEIYSVNAKLTQALPALLSMMNIDPSSKVSLSQPSYNRNQLPSGFPLNSSSRLQNLALHNRSELREEDYQKRARLEEVTKARLKFLPSLSVSGGLNFDSNSFLVNKQWTDFATRLSWDALQIFAKHYGLQTAKTDVVVANVRRQALSMTILTQVQIARLVYLQAGQKLNISRKIRDNRYQHYLHLANEQKAELSDKLTLITAKAKWLLAKLRFNLAYADWCNAGGQLLDTIGYDPLYTAQTLEIPVAQLANQIKYSLNHFPKMDMPDTADGDKEITNILQQQLKSGYVKV